MMSLHRLASRDEAGQRPLSLLAVDIDHFKHVNDEFGHAGGDEALRLVVALMRETLTEGQILSRIGGEEFAVLLPGADEAEAAATAERLRHHLEHSAIDVEGRGVGGSGERITTLELDQSLRVTPSSALMGDLKALLGREKVQLTFPPEAGAAGPSGNRYGDPAGHTCIAVAGPLERTATLRTGSSDRRANMRAFALRALELLAEQIGAK